jgi:protein TonB
MSKPENFAWIFGVSLLAHAPAAFGLAADYRATRQRRTQEVEIDLAAPPPPEPVVPEPPPPPDPVVPKPLPPEPVQRPRVHLEAAPTSTAPTAPVGDVPNVVATPGELAMPAAPIVAPTAPPAIAPPPPPPPPVVEAKEGAHYRSNARPPYPRLALREGWEGTVYLRVQVLPDGHVAQATVDRSAGHSVLDDAALEVVKTWLFDPATQGGRGVLSVVFVPLKFTIQ